MFRISLSLCAFAAVLAGLPSVAAAAIAFDGSSLYGFGAWPRGAAVADFDKDGREDVACPNERGDSVTVGLTRTTGSFFTREFSCGGTGPVGIAKGDFNGDGWIDLAVANRDSKSVAVLMATGQGGFSEPSVYPAERPLLALAAADLDRDGKIDLIAPQGPPSGGTGSVVVLPGNGDGTFRAMKTRPTSAKASYFILAADVNSDGSPDILVPDSMGTTVHVLLGNGTGGLTETASFRVGPSPRGIAVSDFNGDGRPDLACTNFATGDLPAEGSVVVCSGHGNGTFAPPATVLEPGSYRGIVDGDFNGDGRSDLAVTDMSGHSMTVLDGTGTGTFTRNVTLAAGYSPVGIAVGDLNGDSRPDLVVSNLGSGACSIYVNRLRQVGSAIAGNQFLRIRSDGGGWQTLVHSYARSTTWFNAYQGSDGAVAHEQIPGDWIGTYLYSYAAGGFTQAVYSLRHTF